MQEFYIMSYLPLLLYKFVSLGLLSFSNMSEWAKCYIGPEIWWVKVPSSWQNNSKIMNSNWVFHLIIMTACTGLIGIIKISGLWYSYLHSIVMDETLRRLIFLIVLFSFSVCWEHVYVFFFFWVGGVVFWWLFDSQRWCMGWGLGSFQLTIVWWEGEGEAEGWRCLLSRQWLSGFHFFLSFLGHLVRGIFILFGCCGGSEKGIGMQVPCVCYNRFGNWKRITYEKGKDKPKAIVCAEVIIIWT